MEVPASHRGPGAPSTMQKELARPAYRGKPGRVDPFVCLTDRVGPAVPHSTLDAWGGRAENVGAAQGPLHERAPDGKTVWFLLENRPPAA
jgi:hypothetical protein